LEEFSYHPKQLIWQIFERDKPEGQMSKDSIDQIIEVRSTDGKADDVKSEEHGFISQYYEIDSEHCSQLQWKNEMLENFESLSKKLHARIQKVVHEKHRAIAEEQEEDDEEE